MSQELPRTFHCKCSDWHQPLELPEGFPPGLMCEIGRFCFRGKGPDTDTAAHLMEIWRRAGFVTDGDDIGIFLEKERTPVIMPAKFLEPEFLGELGMNAMLVVASSGQLSLQALRDAREKGRAYYGWRGNQRPPNLTKWQQRWWSWKEQIPFDNAVARYLVGLYQSVINYREVVHDCWSCFMFSCHMTQEVFREAMHSVATERGFHVNFDEACV